MLLSNYRHVCHTNISSGEQWKISYDIPYLVDVSLGLLLALVAVLRGTRTAEGKLTAAFFAKGSARQGASGALPVASSDTGIICSCFPNHSVLKTKGRCFIESLAPLCFL